MLSGVSAPCLRIPSARQREGQRPAVAQAVRQHQQLVGHRRFFQHREGLGLEFLVALAQFDAAQGGGLSDQAQGFCGRHGLTLKWGEGF